MRTWSRQDVERAGRAGFATELVGEVVKCRMLDRFWMLVDPSDQQLGTCVIRDGYWEAWITAWVLNNVRPGSQCMDIGANVGYYSLLLASMGCKVLSFEPQPRLARLLEESAALNGFEQLITVEAVAVSADDRGAQIYVAHDANSGASILRSRGVPEAQFGVPTTTLDHFRDTPVDFIKIDIEGAEENLFLGSSEFIRQHRQTNWLLEWRWLSYEDPIRFASTLFENFAVHYVDINVNAIPVPPQPFHLSQFADDWQMLALLPRATRV